MDSNLKSILGTVVFLGLGYFLLKKFSSKETTTTESKDIEKEIKDLAESLSKSDFANTQATLQALKNDKKLTDEQKASWLNVYKGILLAKKDNKWDDKSKDVLAKKKTLLSYGVKETDIDFFIKLTS